MGMNYNFPDVISGDTFEGLRITTNINGSPLNLTSGSVETLLLAGGIYNSFSTENGKMTIISGSEGIVEFNKQIIDVGFCDIFNYRMLFKLANGDIHTYLYGTWNILKEP